MRKTLKYKTVSKKTEESKLSSFLMDVINSVDDGVLSDIEVSGACSILNEQNIVTNALEYFNQNNILKLPLEQMCEKNCNSVINDVVEMKAMKKKCRHLW